MEIILDKQVCFSLALLLGKSQPQTLPWMGKQYQFSPLWPDLKDYSKEICIRYFSHCCGKTTKKKQLTEGLISTLNLRDAIQNGGNGWRQELEATGHRAHKGGCWYTSCLLSPFLFRDRPQLQDSDTHSKWEFSLSDSSEETQESASELNPPSSIQIQSVDNDEPSHGSL